ncbi:hypothetical protein FRACYDRAFT_262424 [Fragilariopsis cylindrus CCMP1102]|uniref:Uncharacterized protein n=1 Tax=Fragilariopsis cylindrus CCMP1102 TaxID=635003 RepID=A0A1E7F6S2_9STRA|nr:hypothetical protein FRACYDRAFT_262424 [Fragilariopsis cylindrus CCMP1102]|eukprot:OEU13881.1 hypothetical protein FRACYDRAFT_262424 [Fragilariopsis cylindrus CCMP1102]
MYTDFNEEVFKASVDEALHSVRRVLDINRSPRLHLAEDVDHNYSDKFKLANLLTNTAIISSTIILERFGLTKEVLQSIDTSRPTTLRFVASESCHLVKEETVDVPLQIKIETNEDTKVTTEYEETNTSKSTIKKVVNRVTQQHYKIETEWEISIYTGTDVDNRRVIKNRNGTSFDFIWAKCKDPPLPSKHEHPIDLSLTWLFQQIDTEQLRSHFTIDTQNHNKTKTPRRNLQVEESLSFFGSLKRWTHDVQYRFAIFYQRNILDRHSPAMSNPNENGNNEDDEKSLAKNLKRFTSNGIFVPVIPLLDQEIVSVDDSVESKAILEIRDEREDNIEKNEDGEDKEASSPILSFADTTRFLNEQVRTLEETELKIQQQYSDAETKLISAIEVNLCVICIHSKQLTDRYAESIQYIEFMLEQQLVAAIGKKVNSTDLDKFVKYHNEKMLNPSPEPFCYTVCRPDHYPDGILSIEQDVSDQNLSTLHQAIGYREVPKSEPVSTHARVIKSSIHPLKVPLNAATTLELTGKTYLHGWLKHRFQDSTNVFRLSARARQFSSFVLVVGTMTSNDCMQPKEAIILRNKDEINIPLLLNEIPTATEFKDAIGSLSPEQQRFAKAFRSMQLESSVMGVCIVQIKPQLEKLLNLPQDSLTKEMKLTEDLMQLFVEFQVPSDLMSYDGEESNGVSTKDKVANVKDHVNSVLSVIAEQKKEQLAAQTMETDMAMEEHFDRFSSSRSSSAGGPAMHGRRLQKQANPMRCAMQARAMENEAQPYSIAYASPSMVYTSAAQSECDTNNRSGEVMESQHAEGEIYTRPDGKKVRRVRKSRTKSISSSSSSGVLPGDTGKKMKPTMITGKYDGEQHHVMDFTMIPKLLDRTIEVHDKDGALRLTTVETSKDGWTRNRQKNLLTKSEKHILTTTDIASEKSKAFDLLDALSRSGSLAISFSELHVVICATHSFEKNVMETVIKDNINPIEKLEMSTLLMASTILDIPVRDLIRKEEECERLAVSFPRLLKDDVSSSTSIPATTDITVTEI